MNLPKKYSNQMFIDPDSSQLEASAKIGSQWVELHTGSFARAWHDVQKRDHELNVLKKGMEIGLSLGLQVNAGHGINYQNVEGAKKLDRVTEFNIGHSIICRSLNQGLRGGVYHATVAEFPDESPGISSRNQCGGSGDLSDRSIPDSPIDRSAW